MKKVLSLVLVLCLLLSALPVFAKENEEDTTPDTWVENDGFWIEEVDGAIRIMGVVDEGGGSIVVPATMQSATRVEMHWGETTYYDYPNLPVQLASEAFKGADNVSLVVFKEGIEAIPSGLCENMTGLETVVLPQGLYAIDNNAFKGCESLVNIDLSNVEYIGRGAFEGCTSLKEVKLSTSLERIEAYTFKDCKNLTEINLANVKTIGNDAFAGTGVILSGVVTEIEEPESFYSDVNDTDEYAKAVEVLSELGIMEGYDDKEFKPDTTLTRAEAAAIIVRILNLEINATGDETSFSDVPTSHWASGYISWATENGIVNGQGDGTFAPEEFVTKHQLIKMLVCTLGYEPMAMANGGWNKGGYVFTAEKIGLIEKDSSNKNVHIKRGEAALLCFKALDIDFMEWAESPTGIYGQMYRICENETILTEYWDYNKIVCEVREAEEGKVKVVVTQNLSNKTNFVTGQYVTFATDEDLSDAIGKKVTAYVTNSRLGTNYMLFTIEN